MPEGNSKNSSGDKEKNKKQQQQKKQRINKSKSRFFENSNEIDKLLVRMTRRETSN